MIGSDHNAVIAPSWQAVPRAASALWLREIRKAWRQKARVLSGLAQPLLYFLALGAGLNSVFSAAGLGKYTHFLSPGIITMAIMTPAFVGGIGILWDRKFGFLKETLVSPALRPTIAVGRATGAATIATIQGTVLLLIATLLGVPLPPGLGLVVAVLVMFLVGIVFASAGTAAGLIIEDFQNVQLIITFILMPLFFFSGALFPIPTNRAATKIGLIININPLSYCVDLLRHALNIDAYFPVALDTIIVSLLALMGIGFASWRMSRIDVN